MNKFCLIFWLLFTQAITSFGGKIEYPDYVPFYIYSKSNLTQAKKHIEKLILVLLQDYLSLLSQVEWELNSPKSIVYPKSLKEEDPYFSYFVKEVRLLPIKLIYTEELQKENLETFLEKKGGFHLFLAIQEKPLVLEATLYKLKTKIFEKKIYLIENEILEQISQLSYDIRLAILSKKAQEIYVNSTPERASVYLNGVFFGKTPLHLKAIAQGDYELRLQKEGYETKTKKFTLNEGEKLELNETLITMKGQASLEINSRPEGAKVYLDALYVGNTPLTLANLPYGKVRLRIFLEKFKEEIYVANLSEENLKESVDFQLVPEAEEGFLKTNFTLLGSLNYYDFFVASLFLSGAFAGGALYYAVQRDNTRDKMLAELSTTNPNFFNEKDREIYAQKNQEIERYSQLSQTFLLSSGISLLVSFYFFYKYLASYEPPIAYLSPKKLNPVAFSFFAKENSLNWSYSFYF